MKYTIVSATTVEGLIAAVQLLLDEGWNVTGGVVASGIGSQGMLLQAMTKE